MIQPADQLTTLGRITALEKLCIAVFPYSAPDGVTHLLRGREGGREREREGGSVPFLVTNTPSTHTSTHTALYWCVHRLVVSLGFCSLMILFVKNKDVCE